MTESNAYAPLIHWRDCLQLNGRSVAAVGEAAHLLCLEISFSFRCRTGLTRSFSNQRKWRARYQSAEPDTSKSTCPLDMCQGQNVLKGSTKQFFADGIRDRRSNGGYRGFAWDKSHLLLRFPLQDVYWLSSRVARAEPSSPNSSLGSGFGHPARMAHSSLSFTNLSCALKFLGTQRSGPSEMMAF